MANILVKLNHALTDLASWANLRARHLGWSEESLGLWYKRPVDPEDPEDVGEPVMVPSTIGPGMGRRYTQADHGFTAGTVVRYSGTSWVAAQADTFAHLATHVVVRSLDAHRFEVARSGAWNLGSALSGALFLSPTTAGALTTSRPTTGAVQVVAVGINGTTHLLLDHSDGTIQLDISKAAPALPGGIGWNADDGAAEINQGGGVVLQIGQETQLPVRNTTGATLLNGKVGYITGSSGERVTAAYASTSTVTTSRAMGVFTQDILNNQLGKMTVFGLVRAIPLAFPEGAEVFLDTVLGNIVATPPSGSRIRIGIVVRSHATNGILFVSIDRTPVLAELPDVDLTGAATGHALVKASDGKWKPAAPAPATHAHAASDITSGTFSSARIPSLDAAIITTGTFNAARIPALPTSRITGLDAALAGKSAVGHAHDYLPIANPEFTGALKQGGTTRITSSGGAWLTSVQSTNLLGAGDRPVAADITGTLQPKTPDQFRNMIFALASSLKGAANGVAELGADVKVPVAQLPSAALLALGETPSTAYRGDRGVIAYNHSQATGNPHGTTADDVSALRRVALTGAVDFNSILTGAPCFALVDGTSYANAPIAGALPVGYGGTLYQGYGASASGTQIWADVRTDSLYCRTRLDATWGTWAQIHDSRNTPISAFMKTVLDDADATAARTTLNAAIAPSVGTKAGNWALGTWTPTGTRQTGSGTLILPDASATYAGLSYTITATTTLTLTIAGTFCYLDANNSASYWYDTSTNAAFAMNGGHTSGVRKKIEIYCDGQEWLVKC